MEADCSQTDGHLFVFGDRDRDRAHSLTWSGRCLVCHEGYSFKPSETTGIYVFCKRKLALGKTLKKWD